MLHTSINDIYLSMKLGPNASHSHLPSLSIASLPLHNFLWVSLRKQHSQFHSESRENIFYPSFLYRLCLCLSSIIKERRKHRIAIKWVLCPLSIFELSPCTFCVGRSHSFNTQSNTKKLSVNKSRHSRH